MNRFFGDIQLIDLFPGFSNILFHNATPAHLSNKKKLSLIILQISCDEFSILTHVPFGSYESNRMPTMSCQTACLLLRTKNDQKRKEC